MTCFDSSEWGCVVEYCLHTDERAAGTVHTYIWTVQYLPIYVHYILPIISFLVLFLIFFFFFFFLSIFHFSFFICFRFITRPVTFLYLYFLIPPPFLPHIGILTCNYRGSAAALGNRYQSTSSPCFESTLRFRVTEALNPKWLHFAGPKNSLCDWCISRSSVSHCGKKKKKGL